MRFITEFELRLDATERTRSYRNYLSEKMNILEKRMGEQIAISFHWDVPEKMEAGNYKLEIEAFPMDKWVEFKQNLFEYLHVSGGDVSGKKILEMINDLEFYSNNKQAVDALIGKPSGDTITNMADQMEYRGPNSHCKACEDEKNGVKHIMAQKHTCRK